MKFLLSLIILLNATLSFACNPYPYALDDKGIEGPVTQEQWDRVLDKIHKLYQPYLTPAGIEFQIVRLWNDNTVNAHPGRMDNKWIITMYGGYARSPYATEDSFVLLACHELGHHFGGFPLYTMTNWEWATAEGQADYFSTLKCMRRYLEREDNEGFLRDKEIPTIVNEKCDQVWRGPQDAAICKRSALASYAMNMVWTGGAGGFAFDTPDPKRAINTYYEHPPYQCRLDTMFRGAICKVSHTIGLSQIDPNMGTCNVKHGFSTGKRPPCWYNDPHVDRFPGML